MPLQPQANSAERHFAVEREPPPEAYRSALREVIRNCIYAVDKHPFAVDLCKVALWIEGHEPGLPLTFLDRHIKRGDSLVGVRDLDALYHGIPADRSLLSVATRNLRFIVMDELHFYRGRQGSDVAMLIRRLSRQAHEGVQYIGTSSTVTTEGDRTARRKEIAEVARKLFGAEVPPGNIIDETLARIAKAPRPQTAAELRQAVMPPPPANPDDVANHPLAAWLEETFGMSEKDGQLIRAADVHGCGGALGGSGRSTRR